MKVKVTFQDIIECDNMEEAYTHMKEYIHSCSKNEDVEAFEFKIIKR